LRISPLLISVVRGFLRMSKLKHYKKQEMGKLKVEGHAQES
jgi:hypothetical protein